MPLSDRFLQLGHDRPNSEVSMIALSTRNITQMVTDH